MRGFLRSSAWMAASIVILAAVGCSPGGSQVLGELPVAAPVPVGSIRSSPGNESVTVSGVMIEKCPEAGCWFVLRDGTGTIRVDTKTAGFVVLDVPLNRPLTVVGQIFTNGTQIQLAATGVRY